MNRRRFCGDLQPPVDYVRPEDRVPATPPLWVELAIVIVGFGIVLRGLPEIVEWLASIGACR